MLGRNSIAEIVKEQQCVGLLNLEGEGKQLSSVHTKRKLMLTTVGNNDSVIPATMGLKSHPSRKVFASQA